MIINYQFCFIITYFNQSDLSVLFLRTIIDISLSVNSELMKILIVDDNDSITGALDKYFTVKGFEVSVANGGRNGLSLIQNHKFDAIFLDMSMPEFSGIDIIETLEKNCQLKDKKIILFTASSIPREVLDELLQKEGVQTYLRKPVKLAEILQVLPHYKK